MAMKKKQETPPYRTRDLAEAAFISTQLGLPSLQENLANSPVYFFWEDSQKATDLAAEYWSGGTVEGLKFAQMQRSLKDLIFGRGESGRLPRRPR